MKIGFLLAVATVLAACTLVGCHEPRKSRLDSVHAAALKIQSRTATGVTRLEYPGVISGLAYELSLMKGQPLDQQDLAAVKKYEKALFDMAVTDMWANTNDSRDTAIRATWQMADWSIEEAEMVRQGQDPTGTGARKK
jgi:hypothetical protein